MFIYIQLLKACKKIFFYFKETVNFNPYKLVVLSDTSLFLSLSLCIKTSKFQPHQALTDDNDSTFLLVFYQREYYPCICILMEQNKTHFPTL